MNQNPTIISDEDKFLNLKIKLKNLGIEKFPGKEVKNHVPEYMKGKRSIDWFEGAKNFWNLRNKKYSTYLEIFENIYSEYNT